MTISAAPDSVLEFLSCGCSKSCDTNRCTCRANELKCTDLCKLKDCSNISTEVLDEFNGSCSDTDENDSEEED